MDIVAFPGLSKCLLEFWFLPGMMTNKVVVSHEHGWMAIGTLVNNTEFVK